MGGMLSTMGISKHSRTFDLEGAPTTAHLVGECYVMTSYESDGWHLSISHPDRNPTWEEIRDARYELLPNDLTMAMLLPPKEQYINVHKFCFHLYQI